MSKDRYSYVAVFSYEEDGISIEFPDLPGCLPCAEKDNTEEALKNAQNNLEAGYSVDMIEIDLKAAWNYLGEIMGESYEGELVDKIFSNFCLGK